MRRLPNYLGRTGPYHESIEEVRGHKFIAEARTHIDEIVASRDHIEIQKTAAEIVRIAQEHRKRVYDRHLTGLRWWEVIAKVAMKEAVHSILLPAVVAREVRQGLAAAKESANFRWAGFVTDLADAAPR